MGAERVEIERLLAPRVSLALSRHEALVDQRATDSLPAGGVRPADEKVHPASFELLADGFGIR